MQMLANLSPLQKFYNHRPDPVVEVAVGNLF